MIEASTPVRVCDNGGWTDTWFGGPGRVLNIAVEPGVEVTIGPSSRPGVTLDVAGSGPPYRVAPGERRAPRHPLIEAAVDRFPPPGRAAVEIRVRSAVPPGCGAGTSAAVTVALLGALAALRGEDLAPLDAARAAHRLEVDALGQESGVQDQLCCALGGINFVRVDAYPDARVERLPLWDGLDDHLSLVYLGRAHDSSGMHREVIESGGPDRRDALARLRDAASSARRAILTRDLDALGRALVDNTEAQRALHPGLVGRAASQVIAVAGPLGATGWKVNGAGGEGGSMTILSPTREVRALVESRVAALHPGYQLLPVRVSAAGLRVAGAL